MKLQSTSCGLIQRERVAMKLTVTFHGTVSLVLHDMARILLDFLRAIHEYLNVSRGEEFRDTARMCGLVKRMIL